MYGKRETANRFRHYERWRALLAGFVAVDDWACKFNPVYGQGVTTVSAQLLGRMTGEVGLGHAELPRRFSRAQARLARDPWKHGDGRRLPLPSTTGTRPPFLHRTMRYMDALFAATADDPTLCRMLGNVIYMLRPPTDLFAPGTMSRARFGATPPPATLDDLALARAEMAA